MTEYHKFLKDWTTARSITSFLGRDKSDFQRDWARQKSATVEERKPVEDKADIERRKKMIADEETRRKAKKEERKSMGGEDINRAGERFKKPIPIEAIKKEVANLAPISKKKQEEFKKFTAVVGSKEFNDTIEDAIKDMYYDQLGGLFPREKIYKDKFLTLPKKKQDQIRAMVRAKLLKEL